MQEEVNHTTPSKLLVIDDQESARNLLKRRLSLYGHEVFAAQNTTEALKCLDANDIDVILLNMFLHGESTYKFLQQLKGNEKFQNTPIIMISNDNDVELLVRCIEAGAEDYLVKPLNQTILKARLSNCIARKEAYQKELGYLATIEQGQKQIKAQEHMAAIGEIVGSVAQELKNPLNFVINFAQISAEVCDNLKSTVSAIDSANQSPESQRATPIVQKLRDNIIKVAEYGKSIDQIIKFMLEQTRTDNTKYISNLNKIASQTVDMLKATYRSRGENIPSIKVMPDPNLKNMVLSVQTVSKIIRNVLDNAIYAVNKKFSDPTLSRIEVTVTDQDNSVLISIYDNGIGIKEENLEKIFEPFYSDKEGGQNPGLGLSNSREILAEMRGTISVVSKEGEFSEFKINIPKTEEEQES